MLGMPMSSDQMSSIRNATGRVNLWDGAIRTGKTIASLVAFLIFVAVAPHGGQLVVVARTRDSAYRNVFAPLMDSTLFGPIASLVRYTAGAPTATVLGRTVFVIGASDAKAEKVLRGLTVAGAYVDELTVIPEEFFTQLLGRMSVTGARLFATTNPDNPAHWLKAKFIDRITKLDGWRHFHFKLTGADHLDPKYIAQISAEFTGLWYRRFILGEWVAAEGAIYDMWVPETHIIPWTSLPRMERILGVGVDYGTTNATAALTLGIAPHWVNDTYQGHRLYLLDEWRYDARVEQIRKTNAELSEAMRAWMNGKHTPWADEPRPEWVFIDPAAASFRVQLEADGVPNVASADNSVAYGIGTVASLLGGAHLFTTDKTPGWNQEAPGYSWDPKATLAGEDKPLKVADHSLDAGRYVITTTESVWREYIH